MGRLLRKCNDQRFLRVQERIFSALGQFLYHENFASITVPKLSQKAHIWSSTFYDHFHNINDAIIQYEHLYDQAIETLRDESSANSLSIEYSITKILYFINKHKDYYANCLRRQNFLPFFSIAKTFRPLLTRNWSNYGHAKNDLSFKIFCGELSGVIFFWGESEHFDGTKIVQHANYLTRLAKNATRRLL